MSTQKRAELQKIYFPLEAGSEPDAYEDLLTASKLKDYLEKMKTAAGSTDPEPLEAPPDPDSAMWKVAYSSSILRPMYSKEGMIWNEDGEEWEDPNKDSP